jgi:nicotinate-nucleotide adenylyltransferase
LRILVLGGSFNPVHVGHLIMAEEAAAEFGYGLVLLVPSFKAPHKTMADDPGPEHRLAMLRLAVGDDPLMGVDDCEMRRGGTSYTIDTLAELRSRYGDGGKPGLLIGDDLVPGFPSWRDPAALASTADLVCAHRSSSRELPLDYPHRYAHNAIVEVSSSLVRERIAAGVPFRRLLAPAVYDYIIDKGLYGLR